jgi:hypothetical protein
VEVSLEVRTVREKSRTCTSNEVGVSGSVTRLRDSVASLKKVRSNRFQWRPSSARRNPLDVQLLPSRQWRLRRYTTETLKLAQLSIEKRLTAAEANSDTIIRIIGRHWMGSLRRLRRHSGYYRLLTSQVRRYGQKDVADFSRCPCGTEE